jgi:hypothetical protein
MEKLTLAPWASRGRRELLELLDRMNPTIEELTGAAEHESQSSDATVRSLHMTETRSKKSSGLQSDVVDSVLRFSLTAMWHRERATHPWRMLGWAKGLGPGSMPCAVFLRRSR